MKTLLTIVGLLIGCAALSQAAPTKVLISTNTLQAGTTFFVSSGTVNTVVISTLSWTVNPSSSNLVAERCGRETQFTVTTSSATAITSFVPTHLSGSITLHSKGSYVKIRVAGNITSGTAQAALVGIMRNGSEISPGGNGFAIVSPSVVTANVTLPILYIDSPLTVNPITYAVAMASGGGATITFCGSGPTCVMTLQECF